MMSSEEETDCFGLYGAASADSKQQQLLLKKQKRTRQRVDAGEPRNSYSSIPNFSSRPSFLGGVYGSIFGAAGNNPPNPPQQPGQQSSGAPTTSSNTAATAGGTASAAAAAAAFNFFGGAPGYGPAKMLNELLGRQVKQASDAAAGPPPADATGPDQDAADTQAAELTQHMLRDILQGRKLNALAAAQEQPNNNNSIHSNNNNCTTAEQLLKHQQQQHSPGSNNNSDSARSGTVQSGGEESSDGNAPVPEPPEVVMPCDEDSAEDAASAARAMEEAFAEAGMEPGANLDASDDEESLSPSPPAPAVKEEPECHLLKRSPSHSPCPTLMACKTEASSPTTEIKRARVENIVSTMQRSSPALVPQPAPIVNGCKKRKLYHPQQQTVHHHHHHQHQQQQSQQQQPQQQPQQHPLARHHPMADVLMDDEDESDDDEDPSSIRQKREEKEHLKTQLKLLHEKLAEVQQEYNELSRKMDTDTVGPEQPSPGDLVTAPVSPPQPPPRPHRPQPPGQPPYNGLAALGGPGPGATDGGPHATATAAAAMYHMGQKLYLEQQHAVALERMKQHQEAAAAAAAARQHHHNQQQRQQSPQPTRESGPPPAPKTPHVPPSPVGPHKDFQERLNVFRGAASQPGSAGPVASHITGADLEGLADILKNEITLSLTSLIDSIVTKFAQQRRYLGKQGEAAQAAAEQFNKDLLLASQLLERKSPRTKVVDRGASQQQQQQPIPNGPRGPLNGGGPPPQVSGSGFPPLVPGSHHGPTENNLNQINQLPPHVRPSVGMFQTPKPPTIYAMASMQQQQQQQQREQQREQYCNLRDERESRDSEQNEALSLVMTPKKKRHKVSPNGFISTTPSKVTDTRITPRTVSRILAQEGVNGPPLQQPGGESPPPPPLPPRPYHAPPMLPVSLPTSVAIPNPSLHESQVFSPYSPFYNPHAGHPGQVPPPGAHHLPASPPGAGVELRDSPPLPHPPAMLHPALLAAAQHGASPDYGHLRMDSNDRGSDCNSGEISYDGIQPTSSTLTPMHLRKAKLMFFWVRYPSSNVLKMYFPDIKFNKNNTAQLVKWFSNFREFYYIQMEKYARQAVSEGVKNVEDLRVGGDSEIYRVLNLHYNRNNHIEVWGPQVPSNFRHVVEQTLKEFFKAIQGGKDTEQSWKKSIYKVISRLDDPVPEYFKSPNFLEQLE